MKSTPATGPDSTPDSCGKHFDAFRNAQMSAAAGIATTLQEFTAGIEAREIEGRQLNLRNSRDLYQHSSYVAHIERYALSA